MSIIPFIIPAYRSPDKLARCIAAIEVQDSPCHARVYDNSVENKFYTKAANTGLREAHAFNYEFAVIINQDCYVRPTFASAMRRFFAEHPQCAIAGAKQLAPDENTITHGGTYPDPIRGSHRTGRKSSGDCIENLKSPWVNFAAVAVRIRALLDFGLMDENYRMWCVDSDWCFTARSRGWEVWYNAEAECVHEGGVSDTMPDELRPVFEADLAYFQKKWVLTKLYMELCNEFADAPVQLEGCAA